MKQESLTQRRLPTAPGSSLTRRQERVAPVNSRQHLFKLKVYWVLYSRDCKAHHITLTGHADHPLDKSTFYTSLLFAQTR